jgi:hypothetical protein
MEVSGRPRASVSFACGERVLGDVGYEDFGGERKNVFPLPRTESRFGSGFIYRLSSSRYLSEHSSKIKEIIMFFWVTTSHSFEGVYRRFGGTCCLYLLPWRHRVTYVMLAPPLTKLHGVITQKGII